MRWKHSGLLVPAMSSNKNCVLRGSDGRFGSTGEIELIGKHECAKNVNELNLQAARYCCIAMGLGTTQDSQTLRNELNRTRTKICDLARKNSASLISLLKNNAYNKAELPDLERLYRLFSGCLEVMESQLQRTITLQAAFPIHSAATVLIHTGLTEAVFGHKFCVSLEHMDSPKVDRAALEREEMKSLKRDTEDIHELLFEINQKIDVKPWATEPCLNVDTFENFNKTDISETENSSVADNTEVNRTNANDRRRCVRIVSITVIIVVIIGTAAGICTPLLLGDR